MPRAQTLRKGPGHTNPPQVDPVGDERQITGERGPDQVVGSTPQPGRRSEMWTNEFTPEQMVRELRQLREENRKLKGPVGSPSGF